MFFMYDEHTISIKLKYFSYFWPHIETKNKRTNEEMTTGMMTALWFHDATNDIDEQQQQQYTAASYPCVECGGDACRDDDYCEECLIFELLRQMETREAYEEELKNHRYGVCIDCGVGLDYEHEFLIDRRETQCDCFTCDLCFEHFHGAQALYDALHWQELGKPIPQFVRISCLTP